MSEGSFPRVVGVVGVGLIGGSLVRALHAMKPRPRIVAVEPDAVVRARLEGESLADDVVASLAAAPLDGCDVVVLAAPIGVVLDALSTASTRMRDGAILTDVTGVKVPVIGAARSAVRKGVAFVGAHPMFGGDHGGFDASTADRWRGGVVAVCEDGASPDAVKHVADFHRALGAEVVVCAADAHDAAIAAVSHLPYVVASALSSVGEDAGALARRLAGRGFLDATRLARFAFEVQGEVVRRNPHLPAAVARMRAHFDALLTSLGDAETSREAFDRSRAAREAFE